MTTLALVAGLLLLIVLGVPAAYVLGLTSAAGLFAVFGASGFKSLAGSYFDSLNSFVLIAVPLYILMSNILLEGGIGRRLFDAANSLLGGLPGGVALGTLAGCGAFAAMCGSSVATTSTIGTIALPELRRHGYPKRLAAGLVASGGTLGILIPPSIPLIVYGSITSESVGKLFLAGVLPGLLSLAIFAAYILLAGRRLRGIAPAACPPLRQRLAGVAHAGWGMGTVLIVLGGIYAGFFTPTEAAAVGVIWALFICTAIHRSLDWAGLQRALVSTAKTSCMILFIVVGAHAFGFVVTLLRLPQEMTAWIAALQASQWQILLLSALLFFVLGMFLDPISIIAMSLPIIYPVIVHYHIDPIWFAILLVKNMELANLSPPVGLNVYIVRGLDPSLSTVEAFRSVAPFALLDLLTFGLLLLFPQISVWLPGFVQ